MKERQILFSDSMVRAILAGRKTQTRRIAKPNAVDPMPCGSSLSVPKFTECPYAKLPGDRLWVRETWGVWHNRGGGSDDEKVALEDARNGMPWAAIHYLSDRHTENTRVFRWRPSIHMPRWASRITLEVIDVRVERLQEITETDSVFEGVAPSWLDVDGERVHVGQPTYRQGFARTWGEINGKRAPWSSNPYVWVISFRRVERTAP